MTDLGGFTVVENPNLSTISSYLGKKFTGFVFYSKRKQPWAVWYQGKIVGFYENSEEALEQMLRTNRFH
jgi:hypothetical protein